MKRQPTKGFLTRPPLAPAQSGSSPPSQQQQQPSSRSSSLSSSPRANALVPYPPTVDLHTPAPFALPQIAGGHINHPRARTPSHPRSFSYSAPFTLPQVSSSGKAVAKAFNMASLKLFGNPADGILLRRPSSKKPGIQKSEMDAQEVRLSITCV